MDIGATNTFVYDWMVCHLKLRVERYQSHLKAVSSKSQLMSGLAKDVPIKIDVWEGMVNLMVVPLDDYNLILKNSFFTNVSVTIMPHLGGIMIGDPRQA